MSCILRKFGMLFLIVFITATIIFFAAPVFSASHDEHSDPQETLIKAEITESAAWGRKFFSQSNALFESNTLFDKLSNLNLIQQLQRLLSLILNGEWEYLTINDFWFFSLVFLATILTLLLIFVILISLLKRNWLTALAFFIVALIIISGYLFIELGWERVSSLLSDEDDLTEIVQDDHEQQDDVEVIPESSAQIDSDPAAEADRDTGADESTDTEADVLNLEALIYSCRVLDLFGMTLDEIKAIIGNPDEEGWFAGDYYHWNDASALIGPNENGISQQQELFIAGSDIEMIRLEQFISISEGSSFEAVRQLLGPDLTVEEWGSSEWFEYVMVYKYKEYEFIFNAADPEGPISFIMARRN